MVKGAGKKLGECQKIARTRESDRIFCAIVEQITSKIEHYLGDASLDCSPLETASEGEREKDRERKR